MSAESNDAAFEMLLDYLKRNRGFDFTGYKRASLQRRVRKRMQEVGIQEYDEYLDYLEVHPDEFTYLFNTILINVTSFFRDPDAWQYLADTIIPQILENKGPGAPIRVWSAGCASGEETYTIALLFAEAIGVEACTKRLKIYGTDVDQEALAQARHATFSAEALESVPADLREKYFEPAAQTNGDDDRFVLKNGLRRTVIFGRHDLTQDAPISRLDLLVCRNTLMYFNAEAQGDILPRLYFALNEDAFLFLGKAEMLLTYTDLFESINAEHHVFRPVADVDRRARVAYLNTEGRGQQFRAAFGRRETLRNLAFQLAPVAQIVVTRDGTLQIANDEARARFGLTHYDIGGSFWEMVLSHRPVELRARIEQIYEDRAPIQLRDVERPLPSGDFEYLTIVISPLLNGDDVLVGVNITFEDVSEYHDLQRQLEQRRQELEQAYEELQTTNEELETTNEELQSSNEELETTNEELQSSNEELETTNEELQSANEELQTMNEELRQRTEQLDESNAFLQSILLSLRVAVIVVDTAYRVLVWNAYAENLWGVQADEAQSNRLFDVDFGLSTEDIEDPLQKCVAGKETHKTLELRAINRFGRSIICRVSISPFRTITGSIQGAVVLIDEISEGDSSAGRGASEQN